MPIPQLQRLIWPETDPILIRLTSLLGIIRQ